MVLLSEHDAADFRLKVRKDPFIYERGGTDSANIYVDAVSIG
jgi:hypothetical protein